MPKRLPHSGTRMLRQPAHNGKAIVKTMPGIWNVDAKQRFIALCEQWPDHDTVMELCHKIVGWPLKKTKATAASPTPQGTMLIPSPDMLELWWNEWASGEVKPDPKVVEMMGTRIGAYMRMEETLARRGTLKVAQYVQEKTLSGELTPQQHILYKYAHDAAGFLKSTMGEKDSVRKVGGRAVDFGKNPKEKGRPSGPSHYQKRRQEKALNEGVVIAEWREVE